MTFEELDKLLKDYNKDELNNLAFYLKASKEKKKLTLSASQVDQNFLYMTEDYIFTARTGNNVTAQKHNRYTPIFKHKHGFFEMIYVYSGSCNQEIAGDEVYLKEDDICIVPPEVEHSISVFDDSVLINILISKSTFNDTFLEVLSDENILSSFFLKILYTNTYNNYIIFRGSKDSRIKEFISYIMIENIEDKKYSSKILDNLLMAFFGYLLRDHENRVELPKELRKSSQQLSSILSYIQNNYKTVTLEELSSVFHFTVSYLSRFIHSNTGHNFKEIIQTIKLNKAIELLTLSNLKLYDISDAVGYENYTHFVRTFKKVYGMSPSQFRKRKDGSY